MERPLSPPPSTPQRRRRSSLRVTLVLIGTAGLAAGLAACGPDPDPEIRRNVYASLEDCRADWDRAELCEPAKAPTRSGSSSTGSGLSSSHYYGPLYYSGATSGLDRPRASSRSIGSTTISRGGFGSSSAGHGASS